MKLEYPIGATPLNPDELDGLIPSVGNQGELNELEKANIRIGIEWAEKSRLLKRDLLTYSGLFRLHKELFGKVWKWAGTQRISEKNLGIAPHQIAQELNLLFTDVQYWIENKTYEWDEIGVRLHHRLVSIHPYVNGNGRLARIASDLLLNYNNRDAFTWGSGDLLAEGNVRKNYIDVLRQADRGDYAPLLRFVRN